MPEGRTRARIEFRDVGRRFGPVEVLREIDIAIEPGERHAIVGENGAGKSTLMRILCGLLRPSGGGVYVDGREVRSAADAREFGVALVHQELSLVPTLSIAENCVLGSHP